MSNLWERFDTIVNADEVLEAKSKFEPIPSGTYLTILEDIEPSESKEGLPMLKGKFRLVENNRILFYNQMLQNLNYPNMTAVNVAEAVKFVGDLLGEEIDFTGLNDLAETVMNIPTGTEYKVTVSYGKKDTDMNFPKLRIVLPPVPMDDDTPFA
jgi:hypothetical protein